MQGSPNQVVTEITNAASDRVLTVGTVSDEQQDLNGEANLTFDGSTLTVTGNLTVSGTTTTISTTNTIISDKLVELANGTSGTPSGDAGIVVERGSSTNAAIIWDESRDEWVVCTTSATGATTGDLTFTPANLSVERIGAGTEQAEAEVHAKRDTASGVQYSTTATVICEDDTRPSIQIAGGASNIGLIQFGDNADVASGQVYYDHSTDKLRVDVGGNGDVLNVTATGAIDATGSAAYVTLKNNTAENTEGGCESRVLFDDHADATLAQIEGSHSGTADDTKGKLILSTHTGSSLTTAVTINELQEATFAATTFFNKGISFDSSPADENVSGITAAFTAGEALERGEVVYFKAADSKMWKAVATAAATSRCVAMAAEDISADAVGAFLLEGFCQDNGTFPTYTVGGVLYTPEAEQGSQNTPEQAAPDSDGDFVQILGWAVDANTVYFKPDSTVIEVA